MIESATSLREWKRIETSRRIRTEAQQLAIAHGLDGFTMEDLAEAAEVSRRTLFNYFPSKIDAVLGAAPELPELAVETFRSGGPHGALLDDLAALARATLDAEEPGRAEVERTRRVLRQEPRLLAAAHQRFETLTLEFTQLVLEREGADFDPIRARLLLHLVLSLFDAAVVVLIEDDSDRTLIEIFDELLGTARELFA